MDTRPHPLYILYDARRWLPFLLIPLLRVFFTPRDAVSILLASLRDVSLALLLVGVSVWRWRSTGYHLSGSLTVRQGPLFVRSHTVAEDGAVSLEITRSPLMRLTNARRVRVSTAGVRRRADVTLFLAKQQLDALLPMHSLSDFDGRGRLWPLLVMAASSSNAALGLLTLAPAVRQAGEILGKEFADSIYNLVGRFLALGLPPLLEGAANLLILSWGFSVLRNLLRYGGFRARREGGRLHMTFGVVFRTDTLIDTRRITALELRQTLFMKLFGLHTAAITAAGYGREKGVRPVIVPAAGHKELCGLLDRLLPDFPLHSSCLRPKRTALMSYATPPLLVCAASLVPLWIGGVGRAIAAIGFAVGLWWLIIRLAGFAQAGFGVGRESVVIRYPRGLALYEVHIPLEVTDCLPVTQNPFQRRTGTCTLEVRCFGEKRRRHRVRALPYLPLLALIRRFRSHRGAL